MAKKLKPYKKAGRVIRFLASLSGVSVLIIAAAVLIPLIVRPQPIEAGSIVAVVIVLVLIALFVSFQLVLGQQSGNIKDGDVRLGLDTALSFCLVSPSAPSPVLMYRIVSSKDGIRRSPVEQGHA
jgi:predicted ABC-type exoprotein transport system permease subunit